MARSDAPPALHPAKHARNGVAPAVGEAVERIRMAARAIRWNDDSGAESSEWFSQVIGVVGLVR